jgi:CDP-glucose 4,6-dehydratase
MLLAKGLYEQKEELACAFNFAPDAQNFITVEQIVKRSGVKYEVVKDNSKHETQLLKLDATKAKELLGWKPKIAIDDCLKMTFEWYENYYSAIA